VRYLLWPAAIFLVFLLQGRTSLLGVIPNLTVLLVYYAGIRYGENRGLMAGVLIGYLEDSLSYSIIGPNLLSKAVIGYFSAFFVTGGFFRWTIMFGIVAVSAMILADNTMVFLLRTIFDKMPLSFSDFLFITIMQAVMSGPAGIFLRPKNAD
jgi:rod shape-determining protein MreD